MRKNLYNACLLMVLVIFSFTALNSLSNRSKIPGKEPPAPLEYSDFLDKVESEKIESINYNKYEDIFYAKENDTYYAVDNPEYETFKKEMMEAGITVNPLQVKETSTAMSVFKGFVKICIFGSLGYLTISVLIAIRNSKEGIDPITERVGLDPKKNQSPEVLTTISNKKFSDVAGLYEVKKDMKDLVDFLSNQEKYLNAGATIPKGIILYGPPGTGKTLLAKAIAGEAKLPFYYMSGSDFVEMYVGIGAKRVRELFLKAKKTAPCIIFIDEIDAIGGIRSAKDNNSEDRKTLNALLTEMDGFKNSDNILVIAATNRIEDLDPALTRPGRFTDKFCVPLPGTVKERLEIIHLYAKNKRFSEDVDFEDLAKQLIGFSPAGIEALLNEAAIISVQDKKNFINNKIIEKAMFKLLMSGHIKEDQSERDKDELRLVAWHEAGHTLIGHLNGKEIPKVTILSSTSGAGGVTFSVPKSTNLHSIEDLKSEVRELYAGRIAELMLLKDPQKVTTGAYNDIERATDIIKNIVTSYGMSESFGLLNLNQLDVNQSVIIEKEVKLAKELEEDTKKILTENYELLKQIAENLLEKETLYAPELEEILNAA